MFGFYFYYNLFYCFRTIVSMKPKDPLMIVKCAQTLIHLPYVVRDLKLAKQYLEMALEMAPNDLSVLNAVSKATEICNKTVRFYHYKNIFYLNYLFY